MTLDGRILRETVSLRDCRTRDEAAARVLAFFDRIVTDRLRALETALLTTDDEWDVDAIAATLDEARADMLAARPMLVAAFDEAWQVLAAPDRCAS